MRQRSRGRPRFVDGIAISVVAGLALTACGNDTAAPPESVGHVTYVLGTSVPTHPNFGYLSGPMALGYFDAEGLDVTVAFSSGGTAAFQTMVAGQADLTVASSDLGLFRAHEQGIDTVAFYNPNPGFFLYPAVPVDSPIQGPADFRGVTVGISSPGSSSIEFFTSVASEAGLGEGDFQFVPVGVGPAAAAALFESRQIDVLSLWADQYAIIENINPEWRLRPIMGSRADSWGFGTPMYGMRERIEENPAPYIAYARASAKATVFALENPEAAAIIHNACYPESRPEGVDEADVVAQSVAVLLARLEAAMDISVIDGMDRWGEMPPAMVEAYYRDLLEPRLENFAPEQLEDIYTNEYIDQINDFDEEAIRAEARAWTEDRLDEMVENCRKYQ